MKNRQIHLAFPSTSQNLSISQDETVLQVLIRHEIPIKHACTNGVCGVCLTPLLSGEVDYGQQQPRGLNQKELAQGYFLPCIARCQSDITIAEPKVKVR
ncbi:2Fe-2S iron-sulfur cluster-binding protein [Marinomonas pollencensis]|uniref:Ferredoxin n=1 Tax=Marinomonas pollencensis TaxID=491954 RepID=A0A3E0DB85_9GAMM|nr:2Fe-2S iron-sulfur cluster-binding protein [Marinomonas pollencensis]REG79345.1 ferredoxin [Marinomonas pollencensis]